MNTPQSPSFQQPCRNLRSKEMYHQAADDTDSDAFASGIFWCAKTQETVGPDGQPADKLDCCAGRSCYIS